MSLLFLNTFILLRLIIKLYETYFHSLISNLLYELPIKEWFLSLGTKYNVNPWIFGGIYVGAIPFFSLSVAWIIKNYRKDKSIILPVFFALLFFISAYIYLIIAGKNVPLWVYAVVVLMIIYGVYSTMNKIKKKISSSK